MTSIVQKMENEAQKIVQAERKLVSSIKQIFKSYMPNINYVFRSGKTAAFDEHGKYLTSNPAEIAELQKEVDDGHPHIYRDAAEMEIDTSLQDRIREAQKKVALEILEQANQAQGKQNQESSQNGAPGSQSSGAGNQVQQTGMSAASLLNVASTATLGALSAGSSSGGPAAPSVGK